MAITPLWQRQITNFQNTQAQTGATPTAKERCESSGDKYWDWMTNTCKSKSIISPQTQEERDMIFRSLGAPGVPPGPTHNPYTNQIISPTGQVLVDKTYSNVFGAPVSQAPQNIGAALRTGSASQTMGTPSGMGTFTEVNKNPLWWGENNFPAGTTLKDANDWCKNAGRGSYDIFKKECQLAEPCKPGFVPNWAGQCVEEDRRGWFSPCPTGTKRNWFGGCDQVDTGGGGDGGGGDGGGGDGGNITPPGNNAFERNKWCVDNGYTGYNAKTGLCIEPPTGSSLAEKLACEQGGGQWIGDPDSTNPSAGTCIPRGAMPGYQQINPMKNFLDYMNAMGVTQGPDVSPFIGQNIDMPNIQQYLDPSAYSSGLQGLATGPVFGNQTLEELENARIAAMQSDIGNTYGKAADDLTRRLNAEAAGAGMFTSGARVQTVGQGLADLATQRQIEEAKAAAEIRGERPELLLREQEARRQAFESWGQLDQTAKNNAINAMLQDKKTEYDRLFNEGQLTIESFKGDLQMMTLYLDNILESAKTEAEYNTAVAKIFNIINSMTDAQRAGLTSMIFA